MNLPIVTQTDIDAVKRLSYDERGALAKRINETDPHELFQSAGTSSNPDKRKIICPICGNGSGRDHTPVEAKRKDGVWLYHCFRKCGFSGNLLKIIADKQHLNPNVGDDFAQALAIGAALIGYSVSQGDYSTHRPPKQKSPAKVAEPPKPVPEFKRLDEARRNLPAFIDAQSDKTFRKLTLETLKRLNWGYLSDFNHPSPNDKFTFPALIVPNDNGGIFARRVDGKDYRNVGALATTTIVQPTADMDLFIVEGAIDGASIAQVTDFAYGIIATGGTSGTKALIERLQELFPEGTPKPKLCLMFDNDAAKLEDNPGQKTAAKLLPKLRELGFVAVNRVISDEPRRDPNKILIEDGADNLRGRIEKIIADAEPEFLKVEDEMSRRAHEAQSQQSETPARDAAQDFKTGNEVVDAWQAANGFIDKQLYLEICTARDFLQGLTAESITATVASSKATARKVALCTVYEFALTAAQSFWLKLEDAIAGAVAQTKESSTEFVAPADDDTRLLTQLNVKEIHKAVDREVKAVQKAHEKFQRKVKADEVKAKRKDAHAKKLQKLDELSKQSQSAARDADIIKAIRDACAWNRDNRGNPTSIKASQSNLDLIFGSDPNLNGLVGFDQFQGVNVFLKRAPWHTENHAGETWRDIDDAQLRVYMRQNYADLESSKKVDDMLINVAHLNAFHAVKEFLSGLPRWDGVKRAETLLVKFLHADDTRYTRTVTMNWLLGALARLFNPGVEFANCLVIQGAQRIGKSRLVQMLGGKLEVNPNGQDWHVALKDSVDDSHATDALSKGWIIEIEEFSASRKADVNAIKSFISAKDDTRRFSYDRHTSTRKRHVVFVVTCNDQQFLRDQTGNTRFIIVKCSQKKFERGDEMTPEYIRQVWAETLAKYNEMFADANANEIGARLTLPREIQLQAEAVAAQFTQDDDAENELRGYLDTKIPPQVIWQVLTKDERRKFIVDGKLYVGGGKAEIERRIRNRTFDKSTIERDVDAVHVMLTEPKNDGKLYRACSAADPNHNGTSGLYIFGTELRKRVCVAEAVNEAFAKGDKRGSTYRITEVLSSLDGWTLGERLRNVDPQYPDQKKPFYRDDEPANGDANDNFIGTPIEDPPF